VKKAVMTIPYNSSTRSMTKYVLDTLEPIEVKDSKISWYSDKVNLEKSVKINTKDVSLLVSSIKDIITNDFEKIRKLTRYLYNVGKMLNMLELPIVWILPTGLVIKQSYLESKTTVIKPFTHSKIKINLKTNIKDKYSKTKQIRALMPNLIHSLDATSLSLLCNNFYRNFKGAQFYSVHDCFGTTCDKVPILKTMLASVYTELYSNEPYLKRFDECVLNGIKYSTNYTFDSKTRKLYLDKQEYIIHDID